MDSAVTTLERDADAIEVQLERLAKEGAKVDIEVIEKLKKRRKGVRSSQRWERACCDVWKLLRHSAIVPSAAEEHFPLKRSVDADLRARSRAPSRWRASRLLRCGCCCWRTIVSVWSVPAYACGV